MKPSRIRRYRVTSGLSPLRRNRRIPCGGPARRLSAWSEGQGLLENFHYGNASKNYGFKKWRPEQGMSLDKYEKDLERWEKLVRETGRKGK